MSIPLPLIWNRESLTAIHVIVSFIGWGVFGTGLVITAVVGLQAMEYASTDDEWRVRVSLILTGAGLAMAIASLYFLAVMGVVLAIVMLIGVGRSIMILFKSLRS